MTPEVSSIAEILWRRRGTVREHADHFAVEAAEILARLESHRRRELEEAHRRGFEAGMEEARGLPPVAASSPTGTPGARCPSRIAHESGAGLGCLRSAGHPVRIGHLAGAAPGERWFDDDDRLINPPATSPTGDPTDAV